MAAAMQKAKHASRSRLLLAPLPPHDRTINLSTSFDFKGGMLERLNHLGPTMDNLITTAGKANPTMVKVLKRPTLRMVSKVRSASDLAKKWG